MILFLLFSWMASADVGIVDSYHITVPQQDGRCDVGAIFAIFSQDGGNEIIGYAEVINKNGEVSCVAKVQSHSHNAMIRSGDRATLLDLKTSNSNLPGRFDLVRKGNRHLSARYKPITYIGYSYGQTAATLDRGEFLLGLGPFAYGITDNLQIDTAPILYLVGVGSVGAKYNFLNIEDMNFSIYGQSIKFFEQDLTAWSAELLMDNTSNSRSMTHSKLKFTSKLPETLLLTDKDKKKKYSLELSSVYEWVLPSWHRIIFGPKFTSGAENELGFFLTGMLVFNTYHFSLSAVVNSLEKLDLKNNKQTYSLDMYWRF